MPSGYGNTGSLKSITSLRCAVISIAAEMMSILLLVSDGISAEKGVACTLTLKPASSPIAVIRSTIAPWMVLLLTSRKVNGMPVGVDPTLYVGACADKQPLNANAARALNAAARSARPSRRVGRCLIIVVSLEVYDTASR